MGALARTIESRVRFLDSVEFPENVVCSHFGEHLAHANLSIKLGCRKSELGTFLITIYDKRCIVNGFVRHGERDERGEYWAVQSASIHQARADSVADALGSKIIDQWNGGDRHSGISIELNRECPAIVLAGIRNYHQVPDVFKLRDCDREGFAAYKRALEAAQQSLAA